MMSLNSARPAARLRTLDNIHHSITVFLIPVYYMFNITCQFFHLPPLLSCQKPYPFPAPAAIASDHAAAQKRTVKTDCPLSSTCTLVAAACFTAVSFPAGDHRPALSLLSAPASLTRLSFRQGTPHISRYRSPHRSWDPLQSSY